MNQKVKLFSTLVASTALLAACGGDKEESSSSAPASESSSSVAESSSAAPAKEQVLHLSEAQEMPSLNSSLATDQVSFIVLNNVMEGLFRLDEKGDLIDGMAEVAKTEKSADGGTYTFHLRQDAKWSNGDPVTADDFVYAWRKLVDPATAAEYAYIMFDVKNAQEITTGKDASGKEVKMTPDQLGITAVDPYTLKVELQNKVPYFEKMMIFPSFFPQNQKFVEAQAKNYALESANTIYNGPFVLSEWKHEQGWTYTKNPTYWDAATVKLDKIDVKLSKDVAQRVNLYNTDKLDRISINSEFVDSFKDKPDYIPELDASTFFLRLNQTKNPALKNVNLRKALSRAFDKEGVTTLLNDGSLGINTLLPKGFVKSPDGKDFADENPDVQSFNAEEAQKLWETAKTELGTDKVTIELLGYDTDGSKKTMEYLQAQLQQNLPGLTITLKPQPFKQKLDLESKMDYDIAYAGWGPDYPDPMTYIDMFITGGSHNQTGWSNAEFDKLVADSKSTLLADPTNRWAALVKAEKLVLDEAAIAPIFQRGYAWLQKPYVKGIVSYQFGGDFSYKWAYIE